MKRLILCAAALGIAFLALASRAGDSKAEAAKVRLVLEKYVEALEAEDLEQLSQLFAQDDNLVTVNVATAGIAVGPEKLRATAKSWFDAVKDIDVTVENEVIKVNPSGNAAWVSFTLDGSHSHPSGQGRYEYKGMRATWGLEKRGSDYLIVQGHWSFVFKNP